jgi:hypothetical protein
MRLRVHLAAAGVTLALAIWLSSGTMAPYGSTFFQPVVSTPCAYLYNYDHPLHEATFRMLDGQPRELWRDGHFLRRLLFHLVALPFMKVAGFVVGGFVASVLCHLAALAVLARFLARRHGEDAAIAGSWLFATYPGITYWAALPYAQAAIVPASVGLFILLTLLDERQGLRAAAAIGAAMGVLFTAYDLAPIFGGAAVMVLLRRRRYAALPIAVACMAIAPLGVSLVLKVALGVPWTNPNTATYGNIARGYLHPPAAAVWLATIADVPLVLVRNFFYSNMVFLPALFLMLFALTRAPPTLPEGALGIAVTLLFLFNNLAPPYEGRWQMRGDFIPRLYQPVFVALLVYAARTLGSWRAATRGRRAALAAVGLFALAGNATIAFGPIARVPWAGPVYARFYLHSGPETMDANLARYGRRPLGFCAHR